MIAFKLVRASSFGLALVIALSAVFAGLTANRMVRVERELQPALTDARRLGAALEATRMLLRDSRLGAAESRIARADSLAQRFHSIATASARGPSERALLLAHDASFAAYYVAARRAAAGVSMSADADGSSAEDASLGYTALRQNLAATSAARMRAIEDARPATAPVELASWLAMTLLSVGALLRRTSRQEKDWPVAARMAANRDRLATTSADDGSADVSLRDAVARLARARLAASVAAARVAKRNNEQQIELASRWHHPTLTLMPSTQPTVEMDVYEDELTTPALRSIGRRLMMV